MLDYAMLSSGGPAGTTAELTHPFWLFEWDVVYHQEVAICSFVLFFSAILCSAAGIGGGGIYVTVLMITGRLTPHNAVPLSKAIVFFGSVSSLIVNLYQQARFHGQPNAKTVIDTDACRLVVPATLIGTFLGVLLNKHTSDYVIVVLLTALLGFMFGLVLRTARNQSLEEDKCTNSGMSLPLTGQDGESGAAASSGEQMSAADPDVTTPLLRGPEGLAPMVPMARKQALTMRDGGMGGALLLIVILGGILRFHMYACRAEVLGDISQVGACNHPVNKVFRNHMQKWMSDAVTSTVLQQLVAGLPMLTCLAIAVHFGFVANRDVGWQPRSVVLYQAVAVVTGLLAGLVGVGGGLILSPFFLLTGMDPAVAVGTSATCVLFTSLSTTMQYAFTDRIVMSLALVYGTVTLVASFAGTCLVHIIQDRYARKSYITFIVAAGVLISAVLSGIKFVYMLEHPEVAKV